MARSEEEEVATAALQREIEWAKLRGQNKCQKTKTTNYTNYKMEYIIQIKTPPNSEQWIKCYKM